MIRKAQPTLKTAGHIINALCTMEWVLGQVVQDNPALLERMNKVSEEIAEAMRLLHEEAMYPTGCR